MQIIGRHLLVSLFVVALSPSVSAQTRLSAEADRICTEEFEKSWLQQGESWFAGHTSLHKLSHYVEGVPALGAM